MLLDEFLATMSKARQEEKAKSAPLRDFNSLDPLLQVLSHVSLFFFLFPSSSSCSSFLLILLTSRSPLVSSSLSHTRPHQFKSPDDLDASLQAIFKRLDVDGSGTVSFQETDEGLRKLMGQGFYLSVEDWQEMTSDLQGEDSSLTFSSFMLVMKEQLALFLHRGVNRALEGAGKPKDAILLTLKWLLLKDEGRKEEEKLEALSRTSTAMAEEMKEMKQLMLSFMQRDAEVGQQRLERMSEMLEKLVETVGGKRTAVPDDDGEPLAEEEEEVQNENKETKGEEEEEVARGEEKPEEFNQDLISFTEGEEDRMLKDVLDR